MYTVLTLRRLHSALGSVSLCFIGLKDVSALRLQNRDGLISCHTTIKIVFNNSFENCSPNSTLQSDFGTESGATSFFSTWPSLICLLVISLIVDILDKNFSHQLLRLELAHEWFGHK